MAQANAAPSSDLLARIAAVEAENAALRADAEKRSSLRLAVGAKGGVSVYGINARFPVTLYREQWERLLAYAPSITAFIAAHSAELPLKGAKVA